MEIKRIKTFKKGQAVLESVLIMVVLLGLTQFVFNYMKRDGWMASLTPSDYLKGMVRSGVWVNYPHDIDRHPNRYDRHLMNSGQSAR